MKTLPLSLLLLTSSLAFAQTDRVGIGTTTPRAGLDVTHNDGIVATGTLDEGNTANLPTGEGTRLMWIPKKAAFRAGNVFGSEWDDDNIGIQSVALGVGTQASGRISTAMGLDSRASGNYSVAIGNASAASGDNSMALGHVTTASGDYSTALGNRVSTNGKFGSFIIGDGNAPGQPQARNSDADHQFKARFLGGYVLVTDNFGGIGAKLDGGQSAWSVISDSTKKEGFRPADGQAFLQKIAQMRLGSWNYKGQDAATMRHYGPMAQDFFAAFGRDGVGTVGNETTINQADFDGVNLIAIKALITEVEALKDENVRLTTRNAALGGELSSLRADVDSLKRLLVANTGK